MLFSAVVAMDSNGYPQLNTLPLSIFNHRKACLSLHHVHTHVETSDHSNEHDFDR
jgi:hypothetical protein